MISIESARIVNRAGLIGIVPRHISCLSRASMRLAVTVSMIVASAIAHADDQVALPSPLGVADVVRLAKTRRAEVVAARARANAAAQRPAIVSALDDPQVFPSIDHAPFMGGGANVSLTIEQSFPLSGIRGHRRRAAEADMRRELAQIDRVGLDVELDATTAFWMLVETRAIARILDDQHALAEQMVAAATARYSTNTGMQADVLRAQLEVARLNGESRALVAETRAGEAMLNTSLARPTDAPVPDLDATVSDAEPPLAVRVAVAAIDRRPELRAGRAEVARSEAEVSVMRAMYTPMAMVRTGPAYTMTEGAGWMVMVGLSIPLWRGKLRAGVTEARAMVDLSNADLEATRRMVGGEAAVARERVAAARERYLALRDSIVPTAKEAITATLAAYSSNQLPLVSTIETAQALWSAQRDLVMANVQLGLAWARLNRAMGQEITR
jgi:cobalt-zinc-cadmium efflux system outer membrane protein